MDFIEAMNYRHATKEFNSNEKISEENINNILEVGRLSPSSFGLEPWKFVVVEDDKLKEKLLPACFNQKQITSASHIVFILTKKEDVKPNTQYMNDLLNPRMGEEGTKFVNSVVEGMYNNFSEDKYDMWLKEQCYIPLANMMTYAATQKIDSAPMEGFSEEEVLKILGYDSKKYGVAVVVAFGHRLNEPESKQRLPMEDIVDFK